MTKSAPTRPALRFLTTLLILLSAVVFSGCGAASAAIRAAEILDEVRIEELWASIRDDMRSGRPEAIEFRARELAKLQADRCRRMRKEHLEDPLGGSAAATSNLARCEADLRRYQALARISDFSVGGGPLGRR